MHAELITPIQSSWEILKVQSFEVGLERFNSGVIQENKELRVYSDDKNIKQALSFLRLKEKFITRVKRLKVK